MFPFPSLLGKARMGLSAKLSRIHPPSGYPLSLYRSYGPVDSFGRL